MLDAEVTCVCFGRLIDNFREKGLMVQFLTHSIRVTEVGNADSNAIFGDIGTSAFEMTEFNLQPKKVGL